MKLSDADLMQLAKDARQMAHAPYSHFLVGVAVVDENGAVHVGCNVENASYPEGICAETNAIGSMIAAGGRRICRIAVAGGRDRLETCQPCGGCRQRISEFADETTQILTLNAAGALETTGIDRLLPARFKLL